MRVVARHHDNITVGLGIQRVVSYAELGKLMNKKKLTLDAMHFFARQRQQ